MYVRDEASIGSALPVAIVGAALRYPGATDPASFHELTVAGRRMFRDLARTTLDRGHTRDRGLTVPLGGLLRAALLDGEEAVRDWDADAAASGLTGRHSLAAETAATALADVPSGGRAFKADRIDAIIADTPEPGTVDVGDWVRERLGLAKTTEAGQAAHNGKGADSNGGLYCSLRAVAAACEALSAKEFDLVLAGGVSKGIDYGRLSRSAQAGSLATGDVRVYDARPSGTLPGEGCGMVALMRSADARAAGLPLYAEIIGWHAADGTTDIAQCAALRPAYMRAGIDPADIQYVEGHGAATAMEDLAELSALLEVLGPRTDCTRGRCALGAVSANIGDTRGAAGIAALLKTALAMAAGTIPPTTGCVQPHDLLRGETAPFRLPSTPEPWPETAVQLAAVNSLGTVAHPGAPGSGPVHLVLRREREPRRRAGRRRRAVSQVPGTAPDDRAPDLAPHGTPSHEPATAPRRITGTHGAPPRPRMPHDHHDLAQAAGIVVSPQATVTTTRQPAPAAVVAVHGTDRGDLAVTLDTIAITAARLSAGGLHQFAHQLAALPDGREHGARAAIVASDPAQLAARAARAAELVRATRAAGVREAADGVWLSEGTRGRVAVLFPGLATTALEHTAMLSAAHAAAAALDRLGVEPQAAVGYSLGEIAGLAWAGSITFGEAARLAAYRAEILRAAPRGMAMARVLGAPDAAARLRAGTGLVLAADEGPAQQVLAGPAADIRELPRRAAELGMAVEVLDAACPLHSPAMRPCVPPWRAVLGDLRFGAPRRRLISAVTGLDVQVSGDIRWLLAAQLTRPALLAGAIALACADADLVLLAAPDPALAAGAAACGRVPVLEPPLERRAAPTPMVLAALFTAGAVSAVAACSGKAMAEAGREATVRSGYPGSLSRSQAEAWARA